MRSLFEQTKLLRPTPRLALAVAWSVCALAGNLDALAQQWPPPRPASVQLGLPVPLIEEAYPQSLGSASNSVGGLLLQSSFPEVPTRSDALFPARPIGYFQADGRKSQSTGAAGSSQQGFNPADALPDDLLGASGSLEPRLDQPSNGTQDGILPPPSNPQLNNGPSSNNRVPSFDPLSALPEEVMAVPTSPQERPVRPSLINPPPGTFAPSNTAGVPDTNKKSTVPEYPEFFPLHGEPAIVDPTVRRVPYHAQDFLTPVPLLAPEVPDPLAMEMIYRGKFAVPTQRPWIEWGRPLYTGGIYPRGIDLFGKTNLLMPHFMVYGDFRTGGAINRNVAGDANVVAGRLNLDMDLELTATERIHAFLGPIDRAGDFTRFDFTDGATFVDRTDLRFDTLFFEGDAGAIVGGLRGTDSPFDLPFTFGFIPLIYQNGVWANDNVIGAAFALPARHNRLLNWSNYDATFFWASDQVTTDAFPGDNTAGEFFGTAWFIDAYQGYVEANYAFVNDDTNSDRSYHNLSFAFTRRYFARVSNSIRYITNLGQSLPDAERTATGHLLIFENSLISVYPNTFVPYFNVFYGQGRPQSLARAGIAGGVLNNIGINFENDGLTGYPTLDPTGHNTYGGAVGLNIIGASFGHQLILEVAALAATGSENFRNAEGDQYACGIRYQKPLNNAWLFRTDHMYGWLRNAEDIRGSRVELRWKF